MFKKWTIANFKEVEIAQMVKKVRNFKYKGWDYKSYEEDQIANMCHLFPKDYMCLFMHTNTLHIHHTLQCLVMELRKKAMYQHLEIKQETVGNSTVSGMPKE